MLTFSVLFLSWQDKVSAVKKYYKHSEYRLLRLRRCGNNLLYFHRRNESKHWFVTQRMFCFNVGKAYVHAQTYTHWLPNETWRKNVALKGSHLQQKVAHSKTEFQTATFQSENKRYVSYFLCCMSVNRNFLSSRVLYIHYFPFGTHWLLFLDSATTSLFIYSLWLHTHIYCADRKVITLKKILRHTKPVTEC